MTIAELTSENLKDAHVKSTGRNAFSGTLRVPRSLDALLESGDTIVIPDAYEVMTRHFGDNDYEFIVVDVVNADGQHRAINFFPSSLGKAIFTAQLVNGKVKAMPPVFPTGAVGAEARAMAGRAVQDLMNVIKSHGNKIRVAGYSEVETPKWDKGVMAEGMTKTTRVYQYEWA